MTEAGLFALCSSSMHCQSSGPSIYKDISSVQINWYEAAEQSATASIKPLVALLGEILEWLGFALAGRSLPGAAFAAFTFANLAPRGAAHHQWYLKRFEDYPRGRRAVIPFVW